MNRIFRKFRPLLCAAIVILPFTLAFAQSNNQRTLQGAVFKAGSLAALQGVTIRNTRNNKDISTDADGVFSMQVMPGDTLYLYQANFKEQMYVVPPNGAEPIGLLQVMRANKPSLDEPPVNYPSQVQFERSVLGDLISPVNQHVSNLDRNLNSLTADPTNMQRYIDDYMRWQQMYVLPEHGTTNNFINPERWRMFIKDWKEGKFSPEAVDRLQGFSKDKKE